MSSSLNLDVTVLSQVLTVAQKLAIRNALLKIKLQENLSDIKFWGKIAGQQGQMTATLAGGPPMGMKRDRSSRAGTAMQCNAAVCERSVGWLTL